MKKILLTLILCFVLGLGVFGLSACNEDAGYNLSNLENDYKAIAENCKSVVYDTTDERLEFSYSEFKNANGQQYLADALNNRTAPYLHLNDYNTILYNSMSFLNSNIHKLSTDAFEVNKSLRNEAKTKLDSLSKAFERVDVQTQDFARNINTNSGRDNTQQFLTNEQYLQAFKHLLDSYNSLYQAAYDTTITFAKIYYSINEDFQTTDMSTTNLEELNETQKLEFVTSFISGLQSRSKLAAAGYSYVFYRQNLQSGEISDNLITKRGTTFGSMGDAYDLYFEYVSKILKKPSEATTNNLAQMQQFSIELFNIWSTMSNDFEKFFAAYSSVDSSLMETAFELSDFEKGCFEIMDNFYYLIEQDVNTLVQVYDYI